MEIRHGEAVPGVVDHDPDPIPLETAGQVSICDFCSVPNPTWELPVSDFDFELGIQDGVPTTFHSIENWMACDDCRRDVMDRSPSRLFDRWCANHPESQQWSQQKMNHMRRGQRDLLITLFQHALADPFLITS